MVSGARPKADSNAAGAAAQPTAADLPWLAAPLVETLQRQHGHATLVHAAPGLGPLPFVMALAQAALCEAAPATRHQGLACGHCASCHLVSTHVHPDLFVLLPETLRRSLNWPLRDDKLDGDDKKKPSKQIRIGEVRALIDWTHKTSARGRAKVAVLHPGEAMNQQAANGLLKTLEEPPAGTRLWLTAADPAVLLPTVRSRCQQLRLLPPPAAQAVAWLGAQGVTQAQVLLAACSGQPLDALAMGQGGVDATAWTGLPQAVARGHSAALAGWPPPMVLDALHKLCHDAMARAAGAPTRYFALAAVPATGQLPALVAWLDEINRIARHAEHPWNEALLLDALIAQGRHALRGAARTPA